MHTTEVLFHLVYLKWHPLLKTLSCSPTHPQYNISVLDFTLFWPNCQRYASNTYLYQFIYVHLNDLSPVEPGSPAYVVFLYFLLICFWTPCHHLISIASSSPLFLTSLMVHLIIYLPVPTFLTTVDVHPPILIYMGVSLPAS